jgi:phage/plasmid-like protein (TIGR03299 family)
MLALPHGDRHARIERLGLMAHNLEQFGESTAFALRGKPAWHGLANVLFDEDAHVDTATMLESAMLSGWDVRLSPVVFPADYRVITPAYSVIRTNPADKGTDVLAVVGDRYQVFQNEDLFSFGDNILDGGGVWESAGSIKQGRQVFGSIKIDRELILDPQGIADKTESYLLITTSHDGSSAIQAMVTPVRVVCQNTLNMALNGAKQSFKVRHTAKQADRVAEARRVLGLSFAHMDEFDTMAQELFATEFTNKQFDELILAIYPQPDVASKAAYTKHTDKVDFIKALYLNSPTQAGITGTAWGALNAMTEHLDYFRVGKAGQTEGLMSAASGFEAGINSQKARILSIVRDMATA